MTATFISVPPAYGQTITEEGVPEGSGQSEIGTDTEISDAVAEAAATGENVEIESLATPDSEVYAAPDGTFIEEIALEPYQAQTADGTWAPIDNTLVDMGDGTLAPANNDSGLVISAGGSTVIARITDVHGRSVAYTWPEPLPTPIVDGDTATYPEVIPGVDLKIKATNDGFAKVFEVKTPEAAASPEVANIQLGVELDGFTAAVGPTGALEIRDYAGNVVYGGPTPIMWDATPPDVEVGDPASVEWSPSTFAMTADVGTSYADGVLTLTPDAAMLANPDVIYPIRIDPKWVSVGRSAWAMVSDFPAYRNRNYYNGGSFEKNPNGTARLGRAHNDDGSMEQTWRLAFEFNTSKFRGRDILDANLHLQMTYSWLHICDGVTPRYEIYELEANLQAWTWNNNGTWGSRIASRDEGVGPGCAAPRDIVTDVTDYVSDVAASDDRIIQFGLKVSNETACCTSFRRFGPERTNSGSGGVHLSVRYNTPPNKPGSFVIDGQSCRTGSTVRLGAAVSWTVTAKLSDDEGDNMTATLKWTDQDTGATKTWTTSGADRKRATWTVRATDLTGQRYTATVAATDGRATGASAGGCTVVVDTTPPAPPTVTSSDYPNDGMPHGSVGKTGRFTIQSTSDDTAGYHWSLRDAVGDNTVPVGVPGGAVTIALDPPTDGPLTLSAWAFDKHGNISQKTTYTFLVGPASSPVAHWKLDETEGTTAPDWAYPGSGNDPDRPLTVSGAQWSGGTPADAADNHFTYLTFDGVDDSATTTLPVIDTDVSYTVSAWVRVHQTDIDYTIASQDGTVNSAFMLKYDGEGHAFLFVTCNQDSAGSGLNCPSVSSNVTAQAGVWYHVTAVHDFGKSQIRIYVDGQLQNSRSFGDAFDANGSFVLGRDLWKGNRSTYFAGDVDDVRVWDRVVSTGELERLGQHAEGIWDFESITNAAFEDLSGSGNDLNGTDLELVEGHTGQAAGFNGFSSTATTSGAVLDTSGDFTIAAWVRLDRDDSTANIISQDGEYVSPFYFGYESGARRWAFRATNQDATGYGWTNLLADLPVQFGEWTHLAVVYRAAAGTVDMYVNGKPAAHGDGFNLWAASGRLRLGSVWHRGALADYWPGIIDSVNVNRGAFDDQQIAALADVGQRETHSQLLTGYFDNDANIDALAIVEDGDRYSDIYLLSGDGQGHFTRTIDPVLESDQLPLNEERDWHLNDAVWRTGDVNGDGHDDLVFAVPGNDSFEVWGLTACTPQDVICKKSGDVFNQFRIEKLTLTESDGWQLTDTQLQVGDVNGDLRDDLVLLRADGLGTYSIWRSEFTSSGKRGFEPPVQIATGTGDPRRIELAVGDFDADWWGDVVEIRTGPNGHADVYVRYGSATGLQTPVLALDAPNNWVTDRDNLILADVTGDGLPDIVNAYRFRERVRLQVAAALPDRGGFALTPWGYSSRCTGCASDLTPWPYVSLAGGDANGDGTEDLFTLRAGIGGEIGAMWIRTSTGSAFTNSRPTWADPTTCFGASGDVNGDGYRDAVLPHPTYDVGADTDAGAIYFIDGATGQASIVHQDVAGIGGGSETGDLFGHSVDLYDADGDGCSDIVAGVPGENSVGFAHILPGSRNGIDTAADYLISQSTAGMPGMRETGDQFGYSVAATNLSDGTPVLVIGVPGENIQTDTTGAFRDGSNQATEVPDGGAIIYIQGDVKAWVDQNTPGVGGSVEEGDQFGWDVAASPNGLIVGAPFEDLGSGNSITDAGFALVFSHNTSPEGWPDYLTWFDQSDTFVDDSREPGDRFGYRVAVVDYWETGKDPNQVETLFAISAPWEDTHSNSVTDSGLVSVVKYSSSGTYSRAATFYQSGPIIGTAEDFDHLGISLELVNLDPTRQATNSTLKLVIGVPDENYVTGDDDGFVQFTGIAAAAPNVDTALTYPAQVANGKFGTALGFTNDRLYMTAPGKGGVYAFEWAMAAPATTKTADVVVSP